MRKSFEVVGSAILLAILTGCYAHNRYRRTELQVSNYASGIRVAVLPTEIPSMVVDTGPLSPNTGNDVDKPEWERTFTNAVKTCVSNAGIFKEVEVISSRADIDEPPWSGLDGKIDVVFTSDLGLLEAGGSSFFADLLAWCPLNFPLNPPGMLSFLGLPTVYHPSVDFRQRLIVDAYRVRDRKRIWRFDSGKIETNRFVWVSFYHVPSGYFEHLTGKVFDKFEEALRTFPEEKVVASSGPSLTQSISPVQRTTPSVAYPPLPKGYRAPTIAVWQLTPLDGISRGSMPVLTETLRSSLLSSKRFQIVARGEMEKVMKEQNIKLSDSCDTTDCAVEYGELLSVEKIVVGSVGKVGKTYQVVLKLINVENGKIERSGSKRKLGDEDVLFELVEEAGRELCR